MKWLRLSLESALVVAITAGLYAALDVTYGYWYPAKPYDRYSERLTSPSYLKEPYFSEDFLTESFLQPGGWITPPHTRLVWPKEFHGSYFNIDHDDFSQSTYRRTINQSDRSENPAIVLLLGGSTVYSSEVPDAFTIASLLSGILNRATPNGYYVINAGVTSVNTSQELERLRYELQHGVRPAIVISYNGVNDIYQGIYSNNPDGVIFSDDQRRSNNARDNQSLLSRMRRVIPLNIFKKLQDRAFIENHRVIPPHMRNPAALAPLARRTKAKYLDNLRAMHRLAEDYGIQFLSVLQPTIFSESENREHHDVELARDLARRQLPMLDVAYETGYPLLKEAVAELHREGIRAYDASRIFRSKTQPVFIDFCHINSAGNTIVSMTLADILRKQCQWNRKTGKCGGIEAGIDVTKKEENQRGKQSP